MRSRRVVLAAALCAAAIPPAAAESASGSRSGRSWTEEKCVRYRKAWSELAARTGNRGLSAEFLRSHQAFLDTGCLAERIVCPRNDAELGAANALTVAAMNAGMASTFLPFACR